MISIFVLSSWSDVNRVKSEFVVEMKIRSKTGKCSPVSGWSFIERWDSLGAWLLCVRCYICVSGVSCYIMGCNTRDTSILPNTTKNIFLQQPAFNLPVRLGWELRWWTRLVISCCLTTRWQLVGFLVFIRLLKNQHELVGRIKNVELPVEYNVSNWQGGRK